MRPIALASLCLALASPVSGQSAASSAATASSSVALPALSAADQIRFLESAEIRRVRAASKGIAGTQRATLAAGELTHDASIQMIDQSKMQFQSAKRTELGFRDYWGFNIAAYRLSVMLGMDMVPPSVSRKFRTTEAAFTWWVDDVILDEMERVKQKREPPSPSRWSEQIHVMRVFDELIANTDRNQGNLLIDKNWKLWFIDHTRAFRTHKTLQAPKAIVRCEQSLLEAMKTLTLEKMREPLQPYLTKTQLEAILARRDLIVSRVESLGPRALYRMSAP
jgi:hypothetical protein